MLTPLLRAALCLGVFAPIAFAGAADKPAGKPDRPPIREFDVETTERLGREIYEHDQLAWVATDVLLAKADRKEIQSTPGGGWVIEITPAKRVVRFVAKRETGIEAFYDVEFVGKKDPVLRKPENKELTPGEIARLTARQTALDALRETKSPWCGGKPNHVVLPDPEGDGLLVYILRPKTVNGQIPVGGHYRVSVSADGRTAKRIDALSASCLTIDAPKEASGAVVAATMSHLVSSRPPETHVFLSLQEKVPFYVVTPDSKIWNVENGSMAVLDENALTKQPKTL